MTIFYINPVTGSNAAAGTSWGTAWRWLPGNGTAINPGDEIRIAKSPSAVIPATIFSSLSNSIRCVQTANGIARPFSALVAGSGYSLHSTKQINIPANTVVPANTKLLSATCSFTQNYLNRVTMEVEMRGVPAGASGVYLKAVLCSDTAGNTPIVTLNGATVFVSTTVQVSNASMAFTFESGTAFNIVVGSIAVYSIASFTTTAVGASVAINGPVFSEVSTSGNYVGMGDTMERVAPDEPYSTVLPTPARKDTYQIVGIGIHSGTTPRYTAMPQGRRYHHSTNADINSWTRYAALPDAIATYTDPQLSFSGTAALPIKIRGGFDPNTDTQNGYTNLGIKDTGIVTRHGAFQFSAGGQYLEFERLHCIGCTLLYFTYSTGSFTVPSVRISDSVIGSGENLYSTFTFQVQGNYVLGFSPATTDVTISDVNMTRCTLHGFCSARRGGSYDPAGNDNLAFGVGTLTYGSLSFVDCMVATPGAGCVASRFNYTGTFSFTSSTQDIRSFLFTGDTGTQGGITVEAALPSPMVFSDTFFDTSLQNLSMTVFGYTSLPVSTSIVLNRIMLGSTRYEGSVVDSFSLYGFKNVTINGMQYRTGHSCYLRIDYGVAAYHTLNTGAVISFSGAFGKLQLDHYIYVFYPPPTINGSAMTLVGGYWWPWMRLSTPPQQLTVTGLTMEQVQVTNLPQPTGYDTAYANFIDCTCRINASPGGFTGYCNMLGGVVPAYTDVGFNLSSGSRVPSSGLGQGISYYGVTFRGTLGSSNSAVTASYPTSATRIRAVSIDTVGAGVGVPSSAGTTTQQLAFADIHLSPSASVRHWADASTYDQATPVTVRKSGGESFHVVGRTVIDVPGTTNAYGMLDVYFIGTLPLAELDVQPSTTVTLSLAVKATESTMIVLEVPPCTAFTSDIHSHVMRRNIRTYNETLFYSFSFAPQAEGNVTIKLFSTKKLLLQNFAVSVS